MRIAAASPIVTELKKNQLQYKTQISQSISNIVSLMQFKFFTPGLGGMIFCFVRISRIHAL